jgi:hypothetical protein
MPGVHEEAPLPSGASCSWDSPARRPDARFGLRLFNKPCATGSAHNGLPGRPRVRRSEGRRARCPTDSTPRKIAALFAAHNVERRHWVCETASARSSSASRSATRSGAGLPVLDQRGSLRDTELPSREAPCNRSDIATHASLERASAPERGLGSLSHLTRLGYWGRGRGTVTPTHNLSAEKTYVPFRSNT